MIIGVVKETFPGENRVALVPALVPNLTALKAEVLVERGAGEAAGYRDAEYEEKGAKLADRKDLFEKSDVLLQIRLPGTNPTGGEADCALYRKGQTVIGTADPLSNAAGQKPMAEKGVSAFALELMPRITRAQSMDVLSSMATIAGYKAVLLAAGHLPRMFPMLMTAAGTVAPARVLVLGAGVAGLQAIAISNRLGAKVFGYDVRPAVKEQVQSVGGTFVELDLKTEGAEDKGGYAKAQDEAFYQKQRELLGEVIGRSDVVISTAAIPGKRAPLLIIKEAVAKMAKGSVIIDLAAATGGNCELTKPDQVVDIGGVTIMGPTNLPATVPYHASQMFAKNVVTFVKHLVKDGAIQFKMDDEITRETLVSRDGDIVHARVREILGMPALPKPEAAAAAS